jgi:hypothetical protein
MITADRQLGGASYRLNVANIGLAGQWAAWKLSLKITKTVFSADR